MPVAVLAFLLTLPVSLSIPLYFRSGKVQSLEEAKAKVGGDPTRGLQLMKRYGCNACHIVPGLPGGGRVGPDLKGFASRPVIGHNLANTPENIIPWIVRPVSMDPQATMPSVGASEKDARDMATYLYALK